MFIMEWRELRFHNQKYYFSSSKREFYTKTFWTKQRKEGKTTLSQKSRGRDLDDHQDLDAKLIHLANQGDRNAFTQLLENNYDRLFRVIWRIVGTQEDAEDIVQDVCCSLVIKISSFRGESKVSTWLIGIALNAAKDFLRRSKSRNQTQSNYATVVSLYPQHDGRSLTQKLWMNSILSRLKQDLLETVILVAGEGLSHSEASKVLNISENTVSWRMHEARKILRQEGLEEVFHG